MKIGQINHLTVLRFTSVGAYLGDEEDNDVLLPTKYLTEGLKEEDEIDVFIYRDSEDRVVATTETPLIEMKGFAYLKVSDVSMFGAFADWGLEKELLIPFKEQNLKLEAGFYYLTSLQLDDATDRVYGSTKTNRYILPCEEVFEKDQEVDLLICEETDLGNKVIVNNKYSGLIYYNDISRPIRRGDMEKGFVFNVREDGKMDIRLDKEGILKISESAEKLLGILKTKKRLDIHDKSHPDDIRDAVGMSKKTFKSAVGTLYKQRLITLESDGIVLVESN
ncbi:MAG: putative RNA-binding protein (virulence factor B family) [Flavobacteriaceae bacterium]|jgi:predicted RNA-binding protein (virulence factor B family)